MKRKTKSSKFLSYNALKMYEHEFSVAWASRDLDRCAASLGKVIKLNPRSANAHIQLARVHGMVYDYDRAVECFDEAVRVSPRDQRALVYIEAGKCAREFFDPKIAEDFFTKAVECAGMLKGRHAVADVADAKLALAEYSIRIRNRHVAHELVEQVLEVLPNDRAAWFLWCRLNEEQVDRSLEKLHGLLSSEDTELKVKVDYQIARLLDKIGDYSGAMKALLRAKAPMAGARGAIVGHRRKIRAQMKELADEFSEGKRDEWRAAGSEMGEGQRLVLLGGHPRSGTTLLEQVLESHAGVVSAEESENMALSFYSPLTRPHPRFANIRKLLDDCSTADLESARHRYFELTEKCIQEPVGSRILLDKNPSLTPLAPAFFRLFPELRFLVMIRDPRDVMLSFFMQPFFPPDAVSGNFLALEDAADEVNAFMSIWISLRKRFEESVCEVRYEDLVIDLEGNARKVLDFLGVEWDDGVLDFDRHAQGKVVRSPTAEAVTKKVYQGAAERWRNYERYLDPVMDRLEPCMSRLGYT